MTTVLTDEQIRGSERLMVMRREMIKEEAIRDEANSNNKTTLWKTIRGGITNINYRYTISTNPIMLFELDMHGLWYTFVESAKVTDADDAGQDRLVYQILYAREMGTLSRTTTGQHEEAITSEGFKIWTDLPYLVQDMRGYWAKSRDISPVHLRNLAAFTARLTALSVCSAELSVCAIWLFRETLETPRRLTRSEQGDEVPVAELLPACNAWLDNCNHKLLTLAVRGQSFVDVDQEFFALGELARNAHVVETGFTVARWLFWRQTLKELNRSQDETVAKEAKRGFLCMIRTGTELGLKTPGEDEFKAKTSKFLMDKLKRTGANMVSSEDMSIHSDGE